MPGVWRYTYVALIAALAVGNAMTDNTVEKTMPGLQRVVLRNRGGKRMMLVLL